MKKLLVGLISIVLFITAQSQIENFCGTEYDPTALEPYQVNFTKSNNRTVDWKTIPTVVHIVYNDSIPNSWFSEGYVDTAMTAVNYYFEQALIQFDVQDIDYTNILDYGWGELTEYGLCFPDYGTQNTLLANDISWEEDNYCNIYIIPNMCYSVLGWSYVTNYVQNARDGVWISHEAFGFGDWLPERNNQNMVLVHELGHYCGLHHVFNGVSSCLEDADLHDGESGYTYGDLVPDTPPIKPSWYCDDHACQWWYYPDAPPNWNSARSWAEYEHNNHMDYYPDSCRQVFTEGQIERMHMKLEFERAGLFGGDPFCFGDINGDGIVGVLDLLEIVAHFGEHSLIGDISNDGIVNTQDLNFLLSRFGTICNDEVNYSPQEKAPKPENVREFLKLLEKL